MKEEFTNRISTSETKLQAAAKVRAGIPTKQGSNNNVR